MVQAANKRLCGRQGKAHKRTITVGYADKIWCRSSPVCKLGEQIITNGQQNLQDGDPIAIQQGQ